MGLNSPKSYNKTSASFFERSIPFSTMVSRRKAFSMGSEAGVAIYMNRRKKTIRDGLRI